MRAFLREVVRALRRDPYRPPARGAQVISARLPEGYDPPSASLGTRLQVLGTRTARIPCDNPECRLCQALQGESGSP